MRRLLQASRPDPLALVLLALAAAGVLVAGSQHARLFHRGYAEVEIVGPLFFMNAIGSLVVVLALVFGRVWIFVLGAISICVPSLVSIAISHSSLGFVGFREGGYDADALVIVIAEVGAVAFALIGAAVAVRGAPGVAGAGPRSAARAVVAAVVVIAMGCAITGIGMGSSPAEAAPAPASAAITAARERIAAGGASVRRGRELFADEGCDRCHAIAAIGAGGMLGPRLDTLDEDADDVLESIEDPRDDTVDGYPEKLMPRDFGERLEDAELRALAAFVTAASGGEQEREEDEDGRRGRGRGRSGGDDED